VGCHTASSGGYWRHYYSDSEATAQCELFSTAPTRNILTYLLTKSVIKLVDKSLFNYIMQQHVQDLNRDKWHNSNDKKTKPTLSVSAISFSLSNCSSLTLACSSEFSFVSRSCALTFDRSSSSDYNNHNWWNEMNKFYKASKHR